MAENRVTETDSVLTYKVKRGGEISDYVKLDKLPRFDLLTDQVNDLISKHTWYELYGVDWLIIAFGVLGAFMGLSLMSSDSYFKFVTGVILYGYCHSVFSTKGGHSAAHGAVVNSVRWNKFWAIFFVEFIGSFSEELANEIHIKSHHPHTNIIGYGDSSTWKAPFVPAYMYMFVTPLIVPVITPLVAIAGLFGRWKHLLRFLLVASAGLAINFLLLMNISKFSLWGAIVMTFVSRATLSIPYIHVNIFQHIGLAMYSPKSRPKKIYQMSTGVLNLSRNYVLDYCFGHGIISCHVEHHLFPRLSDNMCLKIKPLVSHFLKHHGLPYYESDYIRRMIYFVKQYNDLMVKAPPITHFVGIQ
ncbi:fatty acid desaturase 6 [Patella vulgata]|uniref:fatty acid desaturase 6 n=1 Tax=Patella vulgata TaxID=6465 RepID=UPI00217FBDFA|nr:fatty acid desaturase 6 [Patella vulgata]